jgi:mevalonate kinase
MSVRIMESTEKENPLLKYLGETKQDGPRLDGESSDHFYFGQGKLLLTGEYFVLDGAKSIALPTRVGQSMSVHYSPSFNPVMVWKSFDVEGHLWLEAKFEFWHFNCLDENPSEEVIFLQKILRQARKQNSHFLRDGMDVTVETHLGFPLEWGLGSSSTLIYNIAQWAYVSPFELQFNTYGGSGYDIACAQSDGPIMYEKDNEGPHWSPVLFEPSFHADLYFVYLGVKQDSREAINYYSEKKPFSANVYKSLSYISKSILDCQEINEFEALIKDHEQIVSDNLGMKTVKDRKFSDFWGEVKSLGAWGGDFVLVTSKESTEKTKEYFYNNGYEVVIPYNELILTHEGGAPNGQLH